MRDEERANEYVLSGFLCSLDVRILLVLECHLSNDQNRSDYYYRIGEIITIEAPIMMNNMNNFSI
jgi:hypothetical protein